MMTENQSKKIFEKYNPVKNVVRCPNGRAKMRKPLDFYARAAVNLYGIITRDELAEIFNSQNEDKTSADEIYTILLPNVLKHGWYGFYKNYVVHYAVLRNFDWVSYFEREQQDKPRFIPHKEEFLKYEREEYADNDNWHKVRKFLMDAFGYNKNTMEGFAEIKSYISHSKGIKEFGSICEKYGLIFRDQKQLEEFFEMLMHAKNNARIWENKGYTPRELSKIYERKAPAEIQIQQTQKVGRNDPCPCGSGKKYKKCCALTVANASAQLSISERKLFYETWYKLLDFVNEKLNVVDYKFSLKYTDFHDETLLYKIREKLWAKPNLISAFISNTKELTEDEIKLLNSWEKGYVKGQFVILKYEPEYAILMTIDKKKKQKLYGVKGISKPISEAMQRKLPVMLETILLPFFDKIIYDSFMGSRSIGFGEGIQDMFELEYRKSEAAYGIITEL